MKAGFRIQDSGFSKPSTINHKLSTIVLLVTVIALIFTSPASATGDAKQSGFSILDAEEVISRELEIKGAGEKLALDALTFTTAANRLNANRQDAYKLDSGLSYSIANLNFDREYSRFTATLQDADKKPENNITVQGRYEEVVEIPALNSRLARGEIITRDNIKFINVPVKNLREDMIRDERQILGKAASRMMFTGRAITKRDLMNPLLVEKGGIVTIVYRTTYMELKTSGQAMEDGSEGDVIRVKNMKSGTVVQAMVGGNGELLVNYYDGKALVNNGKSKDRIEG